jgi:hypothetical protein
MRFCKFLPLLLTLFLSGSVLAEPAVSDLEVHFDRARWARLKANPRAPTEVLRATRTFLAVLKPVQTFYAPKREDEALFPTVHRWRDRERIHERSEVLTRVAHQRSLWLRWSFFSVPARAKIVRAELHMEMALGDRERNHFSPSTAHLALTDQTPARIRKGFGDPFLATPGVAVRQHFPGQHWEITRFAQVAHDTGDRWRKLGLVIDNGGNMTDRHPELRVWYYLPVEATAE